VPFSSYLTLKSGLEVTQESLKQVSFESLSTISYSTSIVTIALYCINVKNFHGSLTTVVRAQNDSSKTANITLPIPQGLKKFGIAVVLLFPFPPSFPFPPLPFSSFPSSPLPLEVGPPNLARGSGERCKFPQPKLIFGAF